MTPLIPPNLVLHLDGVFGLDVRTFAVREAFSQPFEIRLTAVSESTDVDFEAAIGQGARFEIHRVSQATGDIRYWTGICEHIRLAAVEDAGLSTYSLVVRPRLWLLSQRVNYRVFQDKSELDIALEVLSSWGLSPRLDLEPGSFAKRRYRTQYGETDLAFVSRLLEDIGVSYFFAQESGDSRLVLSDAPNRAAPRPGLPFVSAPTQKLRHDYITKVTSERRVRPGVFTQSDVDYRRPADYPLAASAKLGGNVEQHLEVYSHDYGSFLWKGQGGGTPHADDRGPARTDEARGGMQATRRLEAHRGDARVTHFETTAYDLQPGVVTAITDHPRTELGQPLLVSATELVGAAEGEWRHSVEARFADLDFRPALSTRRPRSSGVESATVTGPAGEEIHTDEFGRVRVHFHWDREGTANETSSCWIPVAQPWAGAGMGSISLPRVGQEVIVDFLGGDPDRPVVLGSVFTTTMPPPYKLPELKMVSGMRSESYPRPKRGSAAQLGGGPTEPAVSAPSGGGPSPALQLGGGLSDMSVPDETRKFLPGAFGTQPAASDDVASSLRRNKALGPDEQDVRRSTNAVTANDTAGAEQLYIQSQKDLMLLSKENASGTIGANQVYTVHGNDSLTVEGYQNLSVGLDRTVEVTGEQSHKITKDVTVFTNMNHTLTAQQTVSSIAVEGGHIQVSKVASLLNVGASTVLMLPGAIAIQSPKVFINPGDTFMATLVQTGDVAAATADQQAADAAAAEAKYQEGLADRMAAARAKAEQIEDLAGTNQLSNTRDAVDQMPPKDLSNQADYQEYGLRNEDLSQVLTDAIQN